MTFMRKFLDILHLNNNTDITLDNQSEPNTNIIPDEDTILNNLYNIIPEPAPSVEESTCNIDGLNKTDLLNNFYTVTPEQSTTNVNLPRNTPTPIRDENITLVSNQEKIETTSSLNIEHLKIKLKELISYTQQLCNVINNTTDREQFDIAYSDLIESLKVLQNYEKFNIFRDYLPSQDLQSILKTEPLARKALEERIFLIENQEQLTEQQEPYVSKRLIIQGLHIYFIDIAREIVSAQKILKIPLMREYNIPENVLNDIILELQTSGILDRDNHINMNTDELEKFIDIYEPSIFECNNTVFDREIFMCMGEIIFDDGIEKTYDSLPSDEVIDYLNIIEKLKIIKYDSYKNDYELLASKEEFYNICKCIPKSFASSRYELIDVYSNNTNFDSMSGVEFEKYCAYLLSKNGYVNIKMTPASGDHGVDLLVEKNDITYAIQCKCYSSNIGNAAVQQAHTGKSLYHKDIAVVMTNQYFTQQAKEEAATLGVKLWDRDKLNEFIEKSTL